MPDTITKSANNNVSTFVVSFVVQKSAFLLFAVVCNSLPFRILLIVGFAAQQIVFSLPASCRLFMSRLMRLHDEGRAMQRRKAGALRLMTVAVAVSGLLTAAGALPSVAIIIPTDFASMVEEAWLIVKATVTQTEQNTKGKGGQVATLRVEKVFAGRCDPIIKIVYGASAQESEITYPPGEVAYLCLVPARDQAGMYEEVNYGFGKIVVRDSRVILPEIEIPAGIRERMKDLSLEHVEAVLQWVRGPAMFVRATRDSYRCDEPLYVEVTLTNTSLIPMRLTCGVNEGFGANCSAMLWDEPGHRLWNRQLDGGDADYGRNTMPADKTNAMVTLQPGRSLVGKARFLPRLADYVQDPSRARTLVVGYRPRAEETSWEKNWSGYVTARCPLRLTCPFPRWASELERPNRTGSVAISTVQDGTTVVLSPRQSLWVRIMLTRSVQDPERFRDMHGCYWTADDEPILDVLASCLRVERDGKRLTDPKPDAELLKRWLDGLGHGDMIHYRDVQWPIPSGAPGTYRLRCILPGEDGPSESNWLTVTVPAEEPAGR